MLGISKSLIGKTMRLVSEQYLFLSSANRSRGSPWEWAVDFADGQVASTDDSHVLAISLASFSCYTDWYTVNNANNSFVFTEISTGRTFPVSLAPGNWPYRQLARAIQQQY